MLDLIGAGGMGEVYRAVDSRLDRRVAIKVLPADISADPGRRARFEREAKIVATLEHPHICTLYDVGRHEELLFLVMEHLSGETLAERLRRGPLPLDQALTVATQIADALAAAHSQHVIHRDLKPANVMLTKSGAKLLDFGIAKLRSMDAGLASSTVTALPSQGPVTAAGTLVGTVPYMAPEQLEGKEADARSDIFSFGAVVYEMLTGARAFQGDTPASVIAAILSSAPPPPQRLRDSIPPALDRLVVTCLARAPADRWQSARDIVLHLTSLHPGAAPSPSAVTRRSNPWALAAGFALCAAVSALAADLWWRNTIRVPEGPLRRVSLTLPAGTQLAPNTSPAAGASLAISPDGLTVAFVSTGSGARSLRVRSLESGLVQALAGTEGAMSPFFSPDGRWIGFFTRVELKKVSIDDGTVVGICATPPVTRGGVWARDGTIYFSPSFASGLQRVPAAGGTPQAVTELQLDSGESNHLLPDILPDGETLLFTVWKGGSFKDASIWSFSLRTRERQRLVDSGTAPRYVPPGYVAFVRDGVLFVATFDPARTAAVGEAFPALDGVWTDPATGSAHYAVAADGTLVFAPRGGGVEQRRLAWIDRHGRTSPLNAEAAAYGNLRISPDASRVAMELLNDVWVYDLKTGALSRATYRGVNQFPVWAPDGKRLAISSSYGVQLPTLFSVTPEGGQATERLGEEGRVRFPGSWSPDGRRLAYAELHESSGSGWDIRVLDFQDPRAANALVASPFNDDTPMISPDGQALAYVSDETGRPQIYVRPFPGDGLRIPVSTGGGTEPVWSPSGGELFFRNGRQLLAARVQTRGPLAAGPPAVLFEENFVRGNPIPGFSSYDVAPDGRFLMTVPAGEQSLPRQLDVVVNWASVLGRRARQRTP